MRAQRVEIVHGGTGSLLGELTDLVVGERLGRRRQPAVPVVRPLDPHGGENACQRVDFAQKVLCREAALTELLRQGVRGGGHRDAALDELGQHPRDQRGVARVIEFELVDAHHGVGAEQLDAFGESEHAGELGEFTEGGERLGVLGGIGRPPVGRGQQVGFADAESAVEVQADPGQRLAFAEQLPAPGAPPHRLVAELQAGLERSGLGGLGRVGPVAVEVDVGEGRRRHELGNQTLRGHRRLTVHQSGGHGWHCSQPPRCVLQLRDGGS